MLASLQALGSGLGSDFQCNEVFLVPERVHHPYLTFSTFNQFTQFCLFVRYSLWFLNFEELENTLS